MLKKLVGIFNLLALFITVVLGFKEVFPIIFINILFYVFCFTSISLFFYDVFKKIDDNNSDNKDLRKSVIILAIIVFLLFIVSIIGLDYIINTTKTKFANISSKNYERILDEDLCLKDETLIYGFEDFKSNGDALAICLGKDDKYIVYRFGKPDKYSQLPVNDVDLNKKTFEKIKISKNYEYVMFDYDNVVKTIYFPKIEVIDKEKDIKEPLIFGKNENGEGIEVLFNLIDTNNLVK